MKSTSRILASLGDLVVLQQAAAEAPSSDLVAAGLQVLDREPARRAATVRALWGAREERARARFVSLLGTDPEPEVRHACALAASIDPEFPAADLVRATGDPEPGVRAAAMHALRFRQHPALSAVVFRGLDDTDEEVVAAARALAREQNLAVSPPSAMAPGVLAHLRARGVALLGTLGRAAQGLVVVDAEARARLAAQWRRLWEVFDDRVEPSTACAAAEGEVEVDAEVIWDGALPLRERQRVHIIGGGLALGRVHAVIEIREEVAATHLAGGFVVVGLRPDIGASPQCVQHSELQAPMPGMQPVLRVLVDAPAEASSTGPVPADLWHIQLFHRAWAGGSAASAEV